MLEREKAEIGVFLCFEAPTRPMMKEAAQAGFYKSSDGTSYPRMQVLTVQQLLNGQQVEYPRYARDNTYKQAPRSRSAPVENMNLPLELEQLFSHLSCAKAGRAAEITETQVPRLRCASLGMTDLCNEFEDISM